MLHLNLGTFALIIVAVTCIILLVAKQSNLRKRNKSLALGMLVNVMSAQHKEVLKTANRGNNLTAPLKHLCQSMCIYMALFADEPEAIRKMNEHFNSIREGMQLQSDSKVKYPTLFVEKHPRMKHALRINIGNGGMTYMQDLDNFTNFDILHRGLGPTA